LLHSRVPKPTVMEIRNNVFLYTFSAVTKTITVSATSRLLTLCLNRGGINGKLINIRTSWKWCSKYNSILLCYLRRITIQRYAFHFSEFYRYEKNRDENIVINGYRLLIPTSNTIIWYDLTIFNKCTDNLCNHAEFIRFVSTIIIYQEKYWKSRPAAAE